jgi:hypothetical protein
MTVIVLHPLTCVIDTVDLGYINTIGAGFLRPGKNCAGRLNQVQKHIIAIQRRAR